ncbi:hypothetical protein H5P28_17350 [Ruficoccus amylovorans]|uniref:Uncharacterized protein n=1 Tax=Ruficoccus amylovorans TaxID=1804625 RepID=A0A842HKH1_9BACT|nr:hypothetical protein [Ruficoccus amylovorans]MBC2596036.1 hypothetical protein [Ruficoccus amylovorans]
MSLSSKKVLLLAGAWCVTVGVAYFAGSSLTESGEGTTAAATARPGTSSGGAKTFIIDSSQADKTAAILGSAGADESGELSGGAGGVTLNQAVAAYLANPGSRLARQQLSLMIQSLGADEISGALAMIEEMPAGSNRDRLLAELVGQWATYDPQAAIVYAQSLPSMQLSNFALNEALQGWARVDPQNALAWWSSDANTVSGREGNRQLDSILRGYSELDPFGAFQYVSAMSEDSVEGRRLKNRAIETVVDSMLEQGRLTDALAWTSQLPAGETQTAALSEILEDWTRYDPDAASAYLETLSGRDDYSELRNSMLRSWTRSDPASVADYISGMDAEDPDVGRLTTMLVAEWGRYDLAAAGEWLNSQPANEETDRAVAMFTFQAASEDPAGAMTWAESITSDQMKGRLMNRVASEWKAQDPEAFAEYLKSADIPDTLKAELENVQPSGSNRRGGFFWGGRPPR